MRTEDKVHGSYIELDRWHHRLHPSVVKEYARSALPHAIGKHFHPTHVILTREDGTKQLWKSRDHRKHRHIDISPVSRLQRKSVVLWDGLLHLRRIEYWNISWWVAVWFTLGSIVWTVNGFASFLPFCNSHFEKAPNSTGWTAWLGATIFEIGSICGMWEAWNREDTESFGWNVVHALTPNSSPSRDEEASPKRPGVDNDVEKAAAVAKEEEFKAKKWVWFSLDPMYFHELGFLAAFFQLCGASIFWISGFTAIPAIQDAISTRTGVLDGVFWVPQMVGGSGFIISSTFVMLEVQDKWWKPLPLSLGWHVGLWNFIGGVGFTLCGALGPAASNSGAQYESSLATFWGSWAFLIGSVIQWYESVNSV